MPRSPAGAYSLPSGSLVSDGVDDILASQHNNPLQDIATDLNTPRPVSAGGTGASSAAGALANLGLSVTSAQINAGLIPTGAVIMWSGAIAAIPAGWRICDGTNGTPDLRDRFVVGAGSTYAVGATGGANTVTLTEAQMPSHNHGGASGAGGAHSHTLIDDAVIGDGNFAPGGLAPYPSGTTVKTTSTAPTHTHTISSAGGGQSHENRPPYYALAYIMKV